MYGSQDISFYDKNEGKIEEIEGAFNLTAD